MLRTAGRAQRLGQPSRAGKQMHCLIGHVALLELLDAPRLVLAACFANGVEDARLGRPRKNAAAVGGATAAPTKKAKTRANGKPQVPFVHKLALNQWLLSLFNVSGSSSLRSTCATRSWKGMDENNVHHFHHALTAQLFNLTQLPTELLLEYDQNIVKHTQRLNDRRITRGEAPVIWKYFQYLTLLFTEIYLDRYFRDPQALLQAINAQIAACNADKPESDQIAPFTNRRGVATVE